METSYQPKNRRAFDRMLVEMRGVQTQRDLELGVSRYLVTGGEAEYPRDDVMVVWALVEREKGWK